jgi:hypothetical protein
MNTTFDYNGVQIAPSRPVQKLRTVKKVVYIDSGDRDVTKYPRNGDMVVYLPRTYENVVSINLKGAEFPVINGEGDGTDNTYDITTGGLGTVGIDTLSFFLELDGLNRSDETAPSANRSTSVNSVFAKIQIPNNTNKIIYSEDTGPNNIQYYQPAIGKLDRLHIKTRLHSQTSNQTIFWSGKEYGLTLEFETLENSYDDFSSLETRVSERAPSGFYGC